MYVRISGKYLYAKKIGFNLYQIQGTSIPPLSQEGLELHYQIVENPPRLDRVDSLMNL